MSVTRKTLLQFFGGVKTNNFARFCSFNSEDSLSFLFHRITGNSPGVIYCTGLGTPPWDSKFPLKLQEHVADILGHGFIRFQYKFSGDDTKVWQLSNWTQDIVSVLKYLEESEGPQKRIIIGAGAGGQAAVRAAIAVPEKVHSLLLLSPGLDLNMNYMERIFPGSLAKLQHGDKFFHPSVPGDLPFLVDYDCLKKDYIEKDPINIYPGRIPITCPVRILHGMDDCLVPYQNSVRYAERLQSNDVNVDILKAKGHILDDCPQVVHVLEKLLKLSHDENSAPGTTEHVRRSYI